ncbi:hypothetical protein [Chitinophaga nivalis]|uniref:Uncharacterized protein n=1 Tax=Chitinophaga nivalis TaxID=2991709 RepID=A0ABT3IVI6_9BACT|nr:hypothetical protein [Chitinophaga nivalis]MCW3462398.1 hypothetical protein [Chitinophaga nivalis]MCW3487911.1 hypothetical protein [Chitinophaga nivalis]
MRYIRHLLLFLLLTMVIKAGAQTDKWPGTWKMTYKRGTAAPIHLELQIGAGKQQTLYPALLKLEYQSFSGTYELLLAKKNDWQLGIGRNKFPVSETPFRLGPWMIYLNGTFDYEAGTPPVMHIKRMWINSFGLFMHNLYAEDEIYVHSKVALRNFLYNEDIRLKQTAVAPWKSTQTKRILEGDADSIYFGIYDLIKVKDSVAEMMIIDKDELDKDTVTLLHNGVLLKDRMEVNEHTRQQRLQLDTGLNILTFFADNYGGIPPNTGDLRLHADGHPYSFDFSNRSNKYATFLVAQLYREPTVPRRIIAPLLPRTNTQQATSRKDQFITSLTVQQRNIVLELWDAQQEDGDSISLRLNDTWIASGFPVKKQVQQLLVVLQPGENKLLFVADNLGSISPNTAVLRIRFGSSSKTLELKTDFQRNNLVRIFCEEGAGE